MDWIDLLTEEPVHPALCAPGSRFLVSRDGVPLMIVDPAISTSEERADGKTVFVSFVDETCKYLTPDEATAMGVALIKGAAQERLR